MAHSCKRLDSLIDSLCVCLTWLFPSLSSPHVDISLLFDCEYVGFVPSFPSSLFLLDALASSLSFPYPPSSSVTCPVSPSPSRSAPTVFSFLQSSPPLHYGVAT
mmetsp:Transcript_2126/g.2937  ORF Transcript_2126/g.2937 Transcript_2126/m.2937 type:complete len:104 (+) Transcript_2126:291-602(+)